MNSFDPNRPEDTTQSDKSEVIAVDLIRDKLARLYAEEPNAAVEQAESTVVSHRSRHQQFMYDLSASGKDLATIQTEWHAYYQSLNATEKHQVWQEFYESQSAVTGQSLPTNEPQQLAEHKHQAALPQRVQAARKPGPKLRDARNAQEIRNTIRHKVTAGGKLKAKHHVQSLLFGLGIGVLVILIFLFGFFNEVFIAPFIQPSRTASATPLIVDSSSVAATPNPEVIIPKINVEIPVNYSETSTDEATIENDLESGIVHYPTTSLPGETGNAAFFGHSSNNIFNKGKYKFAFVLLHTLVPGDTFYLTYNSKVYVYKVITKTVVDPSDVAVLDPVAGQTSTATLITCDPPGTSLHRLIIVGQQISPDPSGNTSVTTIQQPSTTPVQLPGNGPTLFSHFWNSAFGKTVVIVLGVSCGIGLLRWLNKPRR